MVRVIIVTITKGKSILCNRAPKVFCEKYYCDHEAKSLSITEFILGDSSMFS